MTLLFPDLLAVICGICLSLAAALVWQIANGVFFRPDSDPVSQPSLGLGGLEKHLIAALPLPVWVRDGPGALVLANPAFEAAGTDPATITAGQRFRAPTLTGQTWFRPVEIALGGAISAFIAVPEDDQAKAGLERTLQVLSQSFALVPLGVAVFDLNGHLALFNPAITGLLGLDPAILARRPGPDDFLEYMRNARKLPEPASLRERRNLSDALFGSQPYEADWIVPGGQVLRVRSRPLTGGGRLVLFDDVSHQTAHIQQLTAEAGIARAIVDRVPGGIAVFDPAGRLVTANPGLQTLWGDIPFGGSDATHINTLTSLWRACCCPTPFWGDLRDMIAGGANREEWSEALRLLNGRSITCSVAPLPDGSTFVLFSEEAASHTLVPPPTK